MSLSTGFLRAGRRMVSGLAMLVLAGSAFAQSFPLPPAPVGVEVTRSEGIEFVTVNPPAAGTNGYTPIAGPGSDGRTNFGTVTQPYRIARTELTSDVFVGFLNSIGQMSLNDPAVIRVGQVGGSGSLSWPGLQDQSFPGPNRRFYLPEPATDSRIPVLGLSWRTAAVFCNWLHNGRTTNPQHLLSGAYDVNTFGTNPDGTFTDQLTRSPGARFWMPSLDEWVTAAHFDPNRNGPNQGGWYQYPNSSDTAPLPGLPGTPGTQTSAGLNVSNTLGVAAYPTVQSPWGLLDASGGGSEWTEAVAGLTTPFQRVYEGRGITSSPNPFLNPDRLLDYRYQGPSLAEFQQTLRIAAFVPSPNAAAVFALAGFIGVRRHRARPA